MNTSFPPQKYPQNTSPISGGLSGEPGAVFTESKVGCSERGPSWGAGGRAWALSPFAG